jgi:hypothetical protein
MGNVGCALRSEVPCALFPSFDRKLPELPAQRLNGPSGAKMYAQVQYQRPMSM